MKVWNILKLGTLVLIVTILASFIFWYVQDKSPVNVYVLDKTKPTGSFNSHKSFFWILNHLGVRNSQKKIYSYKSDYYGLIPKKDDDVNTGFSVKSLRLSEILSLVDNIDVAYYTDTYEVYSASDSAIEHTSQLQRYSGLNQNDYLLLSELRRKGKLIISEYNLFDYPTSELVRRKTENLFDIHYTGWLGGCIKELDKKSHQVPNWIVKMYEKNGQNWNFSGSGILLINRNGKVIVLESDKHLLKKYPYIETTEYGQNKYKLPSKQSYSGWFDIIETGTINTTVSKFTLMLTDQGKKMMKENQIPSEFPAVIEHLDAYKFYYFAGDFAKRNISMNTSYFSGIVSLRGTLYSSNSGSQSAFFWRYYYPLVTNILKNNHIVKK